MVDWGKHYNAIYLVHGVEATLTLAESNAVHEGLTVIDKTAGVEVAMGGDVSMNTIKPACAIRVVELTERGIALTALRGSHIEFNDVTWRIENRLPKPSPDGEMRGEIYLILIEDANG